MNYLANILHPKMLALFLLSLAIMPGCKQRHTIASDAKTIGPKIVLASKSGKFQKLEGDTAELIISETLTRKFKYVFIEYPGVEFKYPGISFFGEFGPDMLDLTMRDFGTQGNDYHSNWKCSKAFSFVDKDISELKALTPESSCSVYVNLDADRFKVEIIVPDDSSNGSEAKKPVSNPPVAITSIPELTKVPFYQEVLGSKTDEIYVVRFYNSVYRWSTKSGDFLDIANEFHQHKFRGVPSDINQDLHMKYGVDTLQQMEEIFLFQKGNIIKTIKSTNPKLELVTFLKSLKN